MSTHVPNYLRKVVKTARKAGWEYDMTGRGHPRLTPPPGARDGLTGELAGPITFASSPSDHRGHKNGLADLRRRGLDV